MVRLQKRPEEYPPTTDATAKSILSVHEREGISGEWILCYATEGLSDPFTIVLGRAVERLLSASAE